MMTYRVQLWNGQELLSDIPGLSIDAAIEVADASRIGNVTSRIMAEQGDWCQVRGPSGLRSGTFAETTLVTYPVEP